MRAHFGDVSVFKEIDSVAIADGGQTMGDEERGFSFGYAVDGFLNQRFCFAVDVCRRFIQNQHARLVRDGARKGNQLLFALAVPAMVCSSIGGILGSRMAIKKGAKFIRYIMLVVVFMILVKLVIDWLWPNLLS